METEWRSNLVKLRNSIMLCPRCKAKNEEVENFFDPDASERQRCWSCRRALARPKLLKLGNASVVVADGLQLFRTISILIPGAGGTSVSPLPASVATRSSPTKSA